MKEIPDANEARTLTKNNIKNVISFAVTQIFDKYILPSIKKGEYSITFINRDNSNYDNVLKTNNEYPCFERMDLIKQYLENKGYKCEFGTSIDGRNESYEDTDKLKISWD